MKFVVITLLAAAALGQIHPPMQNCTAKAACDQEVQKLCGNKGTGGNDCMECAYQHKSDFDKAGCDLFTCRQEIGETCADCDNSCLPKISDMCADSLNDTQACIRCANHHYQDLRKAGCNEGECRRPIYNLCGYNEQCAQCQVLIHEVCPGKTGTSCEDCVGDNMQRFNTLCPLQQCANEIQSTCKAVKPPKTDCTKCADDLNAVCPNEAGKGQQCFQCVEHNAGDLMKKGCNLREPECQRALHDACGGGEIHHRCDACDQALNQYCSSQEGQQCLDCLGKHVSQLQRGHCNMRQCGKELEEKCNAHPPNPGSCAGCVADVHQYCALGNHTTIHECEKCVADHVGDFIYSKCDIREYNCGRAIFNACRHHKPHPGPPTGVCSGCQKDFKQACENTVGHQEQCTECIEKHYQAWNKDGGCNVSQCLPSLNKMCQKDATRLHQATVNRVHKVPMKRAAGNGHH